MLVWMSMHNVIIVIVAVIMGVSPLPTIAQHQPVVHQDKPASVQLEKKASAAPEPKSVETKTPTDTKPTEIKEQTWQDNPQHCNQDTQFISADAPFNCIDKPQAAPAAAKQAAPVAAQSAPVSSNSAKAFIYAHESGNNPGAINKSSGACGLGQALPCSKMPCSLSDYACQDNFFTAYMQGRYGTWENAQAFWLSHSWW